MAKSDGVARILALAAIGQGGGGGTGTSNYLDLENKPKINNVELIGNKTLEDLGIDVSIDGDTITKNAEEKIQTVGIKDVNTEVTNKFWTGTRAEYEALKTYDNNTFYAITDDVIETVNSDWGANEGEPGFIKNRTHYKKNRVGVMFSETDSVRVDWVQTLDGTVWGQVGIERLPVENAEYITLIAGENKLVKLKRYTIVSATETSYYYGNPGAVAAFSGDTSYKDNGMPMALLTDDNQTILALKASKELQEQIIKSGGSGQSFIKPIQVLAITTEVVKLSNEYLDVQLSLNNTMSDYVKKSVMQKAYDAYRMGNIPLLTYVNEAGEKYSVYDIDKFDSYVNFYVQTGMDGDTRYGVGYLVFDRYKIKCGLDQEKITSVSIEEINDMYTLADNANILGINNTTEFIPEQDYQPATKKYVDNSTEGLKMAITLTENGDGTYTSDKTYDQIRAVYEANGVLIACVGNSQLPLMNGEVGSDGGFGLTFGYTIIKSEGQVVSTRSIHYFHTSTQESWTEMDLNGEYLSNVFFDITLTKDTTAGLLSNKTTAEIKEAVASGLTVRAIYNKSLIPLTFMSDNTLIFTLISDSQSVTITCDNDVWTETVTKLLPLSGGAMDGNIDMSGNGILNVQKIHVDGEAPIYLGSTIETGVTNASRITGIAGGGAAVVRANTQNTYDPLFIAEPTNINHAATKGYVDSKITSNQLEHNTLYFGLIDGTNDNWFSKEKLQPVLQDAYINGYHDIMIKTTTGSRFITCSGGDLQSLGKDTSTNLQFVSLQNITGSTTAPTTIFYGYCYANGVKLDESGNVTISGSVGKSGGSVKAMKDTAFTEITGYDATKTQVLKNINGTLTWVNEG